MICNFCGCFTFFFYSIPTCHQLSLLTWHLRNEHRQVRSRAVNLGKLCPFVYLSPVTNMSSRACVETAGQHFTKWHTLNLFNLAKRWSIILPLQIHFYVWFNLHNWLAIMVIAFSYPDGLFFKWLYTVSNLCSQYSTQVAYSNVNNMSSIWI